MRIKTTMRNLLGWLLIKIKQKITIFGKDYTLLTEIQTGATATEQNGSSSKNLHTQLPLAPVSTDYIPKELKARNGTDTHTPSVTAALLTGQNCEAVSGREK